MYKQGDMVKVYWIDSVSQSGWGDFRHDGMDCESTGFFYEDGEDYVVIYQSHLYNNSTVSPSIENRADYLQIPKVAIKLITRLEEIQ